jgi:hypothetical protein
LATAIANAAAGLTGLSGEVTHQAEAADWSRQTVYDHAQEVQAAREAEHQGGPARGELLGQNNDLRREDTQLGGWLAQTVAFPPSRQRESTVTAAAMGWSLNHILVLLAMILATKARPGRSTLHRGIKAAGLAAGRVLKSLDARGRASVRVGCLEEIFFHGRPVRVGVEPASLAWSLGQKADDRTGATWAKALHDWTAPEFVTADAGTGLQAGITAVQQQRRGQGQTLLENGRDVFHTTQEARRVLRLSWGPGQRCWGRAEAATRRVEQAQRRGQDSRGMAVAAPGAWKKAEAASRQYERSDAGWKRAHGALAVFRPDGRLNDRAWAQEPIASALHLVSGRAWSKVRGFLQAEESLTSLDRLDRQLRGAIPGDQLRGELVRSWWLRRCRPRANPRGVVVGAGHVAHRVQPVVCQEVDANWRESYGAVSRVSRRAVRASGAVECRNSVLRMHPSRHRTVTQGRRDLKRLYGNGRECRPGKRRRQSPYELLGRERPSSRFWDRLGMPTPTEGMI